MSARARLPVRPVHAATRRPNYRLRRLADRSGVGDASALVLLIWWLLPIYNMVLIALDPDGTTGVRRLHLVRRHPPWKSFDAVLFQGYWYLHDFWRQFGNSFYIGVMTMVLTVAIGSLASFALGRMRLEPRLGGRRTRRC